jgi:flagellar hook-associated protein 3 FlgL
MRVSENAKLRNISTNLSQLTERQAEATARASSGIRLDQVSTDPAAADQVSRLNASLGQAQTLRKNIGLFRTNASSTESALAEGMDALTRARELAMQGANDSMSADNRATLAKEIASIREQMLALANSKGTNGYLFSGHKTDTAAFDATGTYQGDLGAANAEVSPGVSVQVNTTGEAAFAPPSGVNVFAELASLENDLNTGTAASIAAHLTALDTAFEQLSNARSQTGVTMNRLDTADFSLEQSELGITKRQSSLVDADAVETISQLTMLNTTLQQAISVARTTLNLNPDRF